ncbi:MAG: PAS domain-containing sensor histidine kinase [Alphaproteobacteria bacterium]|nr:PAS domain-containing sensor histidine kinase [Alphaproteobacteria bacterium]
MNFQAFGDLVSRLSLSRRVAALLSAAVVLSCAATYIVLTKRSNDIDTVYWLLNLDLVLLLLIGTVIAHQIARLWSERKRGIAGARLHVRLVLVFGVLAATPAILMAIFSSFFLYFGIHAWFNDRVSTAIHASLEVAQAYLNEHQQVIRADVLAMANDLNREASELTYNPEAFNSYMQTESQLRNLPEAIVVTSSGKTIARSRLSFTLELDNIPQKILREAEKGDVVLVTGDSRDRIRALVKLDRYFDSYLYVGRLVDANVLAHIQTTENAVEEYTTLQGKKSQLQVSVTVIFMIVALILLLAAIWFGLFFAEQLVTPISALILAAERVRAGDLGVRVPESANDDEVGLLGRVFNRMTGQIKEQHDELIAANQMLDERRRFTEAVLSGASSGIIGLDLNGFITLANSRAEELLVGDHPRPFIGAHLVDFIPETAELLQKAYQYPDKPASLQLEFALGNGPRRTIFLHIMTERGGDGAVATIDDISALVSAQRKAAWADVARRIAHEIKNPLTPIQLSAERLKRKYLPQIHDDPETFEKCTDTIVRQVNEIGHMVNEFSAYARMPVAMKRPENIVEVCQDALVLQKHAHAGIRFGFIASEPVIQANCDRSQLTQVITNLLQNAVDSIHERQQQTPGEGNIKLVVEQKGDNVFISVEDNGVGLPEKERDKLMEPYVTTKKKGSGLGLAIVKKIMEDHEGSVVLEDSVRQDTEYGVKATIIFPRDMKS